MIGGVLFGVGFFAWMLSMRIAESKSLEVLNISKLANMFHILFIAGLATLVVVLSAPHGNRIGFEHLWLVPLAAPVYYLVYALFARKHRESWAELFRVDKWNGLVLATSILAVTTVTVFV